MFTLLTMCYRCEVTPWQVIQGQLEPLERVIREGTNQSSPLPPRSHRGLDRDACLRQFHMALNTSGIPPSLHQVAKDLGQSSTSLLTYHFPKECALIVRQYAKYQDQRKHQRLLKVREEVRQAVFSLYARGEYPLIYKLSDVFPNGLMRQREAREAWREALQELGLES